MKTKNNDYENEIDVMRENDEDFIEEDIIEDEEDYTEYENRRSGVGTKALILMIVVLAILVSFLGYRQFYNISNYSTDELKGIKIAEEILDVMYKTNIDNVSVIDERLKSKFITSEYYKIEPNITNMMNRYSPYMNSDNSIKYYYKTTYKVKDGFTVLLGYRIVKGDAQSSVKESHFHFDENWLVDEYNEYDLIDSVTY